MTHKKRLAYQTISIKFLLWIAALIAFLFITDILYIWKSYEKQRIVVARNFRLLDLSGAIVHLDEVLTMSTQMAVQTGEERWKKRYFENKPRLESAIREVRVIAPDIFISTNATWLDSANNKLVEMDRLAFDFVRQGRICDANILLNSKGYGEQKQICAKGIEAIALAVKRQTLESLYSVRRWLIYAATAAALILPVLLMIAIQIQRSLRKHAGGISHETST